MKEKSLLNSGVILKTAVFWLGFVIAGSYATLEVKWSWRYVEYDYDSIEQKAEAVQSGSYNYTNNIIVDFDVSPAGKVFVTLERHDGVPASLATILPKKRYGGGPLLRPYPDWSWTNLDNCRNLIGVYRVATDECNRLWVLDSGKVNNELAVCPPKLLAFDMTTDDNIESVEIPKDLVYGDNGESLFNNIIVDTVGENCTETNVYMADLGGNGLVIWNGKKFWRIESPYFDPTPKGSKFSVNGEKTFDLSRGLVGMSITRDEPNVMNRLFYFRPVSSYDLYHTKVVDLQLFKNNQTDIDYVKEPSELKGQSVNQAFSNKGILFYGSVTDSSIMCWNRHKPFKPENTATVAADPNILQWPDSIKIIRKNDGANETLWVLSDRWQRFKNRHMQFWETNFRILVGNVDDLVRDTVCE